MQPDGSTIMYIHVPFSSEILFLVFSVFMECVLKILPDPGPLGTAIKKNGVYPRAEDTWGGC